MFSTRFARIPLIVVLVLMAFAPARAEGVEAPANDNLANAITIDALPFTAAPDLTAATPEAGEKFCSAAAKTAWYTLTPSTNVDFRVSATGTAVISPWLTLYEDSPSGENLTPIDTCHSSLRDTLTAGKTYYVQLGIELFQAGAATITAKAAAGMTGRVTDVHGDPIEGVCVEAVSNDEELFYPYGYDETDADGTYTILDLLPSDYYVAFYSCQDSRYANEYYDDTYDPLQADLVTVSEGAMTAGIDAVLEEAATISGTVTVDGRPVQACVRAYDAVTGGVVGYAYSNYQTGEYVLGVGGGGNVKVRFGCEWQEYTIEWYEDAPDAASATAIPVSPGGAVTGIDAELARRVQPANDMFADAATVPSLPFSATFDSYFAGQEESEPLPCNTDPQRTVWYRFAPDSDAMVAINTRGSESPAILGVYTVDSQGSYHSVACNHENTRGGDQIGFNAHKDVQYFIQVGASNAGVMHVSIDWAFGVTPLTFEAGQPCLVACPYWASPQADTVAERESTCADEPPSPDGSWSDEHVKVPETVQIGDTDQEGVPTELVFTLSPQIDHDSWICYETPHDGKRYVATGANTTSEMCAPGPIACEEQITIPVVPGEEFVLRIYNWADTNKTPVASFGYKVARP
jgi:hypothetical protein